jgi:regulator of RNase E activity RraA
VVIGRISVSPGDLIVGDCDGVVVVPRTDVETVATRLDSVRSAESTFEADVANGLRVPDFIQSLLQSDRVRYLD